MKATNGEICCVCGQPATDRNFAGDGFCATHLASWQAYAAQPRAPHISLNSAFQSWLVYVRQPSEEVSQ